VSAHSLIFAISASCGSRVNIGTGYHREHSPDAWVDLVECAAQVERFVSFANEYAETPFKMRRESKSRRSLFDGSDSWTLPGDLDSEVTGIQRDEYDFTDPGADTQWQ